MIERVIEGDADVSRETDGAARPLAGDREDLVQFVIDDVLHAGAAVSEFLEEAEAEAAGLAPGVAARGHEAWSSPVREARSRARARSRRGSRTDVLVEREVVDEEVVSSVDESVRVARVLRRREVVDEDQLLHPHFHAGIARRIG